MVAVQKVWYGGRNAGLIKLPRWVLAEAKCEVGDYVVVRVESGRIILTPLSNLRESEANALPEAARPPLESST